MKTLAILAAGAFCLLLVIPSCAPSPESYAAATATLWRAEAIRTEDAGNVQATIAKANSIQTADAVSNNGTATAVMAAAQATQTAVPFNAGIVETNANTANAKSWLFVGLTAGLVLATILFALAMAAWMQTRAKIIPRDKTGQLPAIMDGHNVAVPSRALGAAFTIAHTRNFFWQILHRKESPDVPLQVADGNADSDHYLAIAQADQQTAAVAALMRPGNTRQDRNGRLEVIKKDGTSDVWGRQVSAPQTRVIANGNDAIEIIAKMLGDKLPKEISQPEISPALPESAFVNLEESPVNAEEESR